MLPVGLQFLYNDFTPYIRFLKLLALQEDIQVLLF